MRVDVGVCPGSTRVSEEDVELLAALFAASFNDRSLSKYRGDANSVICKGSISSRLGRRDKQSRWTATGAFLGDQQQLRPQRTVLLLKKGRGAKDSEAS